MIAFSVPGPPVAWARSGGRGKVRFTPAPQRNFANLVKMAAEKAMGGSQPLEGPLELTVRATFPVPASWSKKKATAARWRTSKPDIDNLANIIADAMNTIVFVDDAQIASLAVQKVYGLPVGVTVSVAPLDEGDEQP